MSRHPGRPSKTVDYKLPLVHVNPDFTDPERLDGFFPTHNLMTNLAVMLTPSRRTIKMCRLHKNWAAKDRAYGRRLVAVEWRLRAVSFRGAKGC